METTETQEANEMGENTDIEEAPSSSLEKLVSGLDDVKRYVAWLVSRAQKDDANLKPFIEEVRKSLSARDELDSGRAYASLFKELLHVVDRLQEQGDDDFSKELLDILSMRGLTEIEASGVVNSSVHEVVDTESADNGEDGEILRVVRRGYLLGGAVLRPAQVVIAKREQEGTKEESNGLS